MHKAAHSTGNKSGCQSQLQAELQANCSSSQFPQPISDRGIPAVATPAHRVFRLSEVENSWSELVRPARLERATLCLEGRCSIQLSYERTVKESNDDAAGSQASVCGP